MSSISSLPSVSISPYYPLTYPLPFFLTVPSLSCSIRCCLLSLLSHLPFYTFYFCTFCSKFSSFAFVFAICRVLFPPMPQPQLILIPPIPSAPCASAPSFPSPGTASMCCSLCRVSILLLLLSLSLFPSLCVCVSVYTLSV